MKQNHKIYTFVILIISFILVAVFVGILWYLSTKFSSCDYWKDNIYHVDSGCRDVYERDQQKIGSILVAFLPLFLVSITLLFIRREAFIAWLKFAGVAFPLMLGILWYTYNYTDPITHGFMGGPTESQIATAILPALFVIISLGIIIVKHRELRGK